MKKKLVSVAVGYAFVALGAQAAYADEGERIPVEESVSDATEDLGEEDRKQFIVLGSARTDATVVQSASANVRAIPEGTGSGIAIGSGSQALGTTAIAIGSNAIAEGLAGQNLGRGVAIGTNAKAASAAIALGYGADGSGAWGTAIGYGAQVASNASESVALGHGSVADKSNTVSVGSSAGIKRVITNVGNGTVASGSTDAVTGDQLYTISAKFNTPVLGDNASASGDGAVAVGNNAAATRASTIAIGKGAQATGSSSSFGAIAIGDGAHSAEKGGIAIGINASAGKEGNWHGVAIGMGSNASHYRGVAIGSESVTDRANSVSVGASGLKRQITNVATGTEDTDAVNVKQLTDAIASVEGGGTDPLAVKYDSATKD
ncbi:YadA family autotransporter adhesin, partial [Burkholderia contaminans]|uniref:YadA family autotransporter adhesin n=1 Tax=Burkholderia contaminans TaxID=488447 RepID=UPI003463CEEC